MTAKNEVELQELAELLRRRPMTIARIAAKTKCSKVTAYKRVRALRNRGFAVQVKRVRGSLVGPYSTEYSLPKRRNSV